MPRGGQSPSVGVVGHIEWVTHALGRSPHPGSIVDLTDPMDEPAGGGGVAAAAMARLTGSGLLITALGSDERAERSHDELIRRGVEVVGALRDAGQTPVLSITHPGGERTIMVVGSRLQPRATDALPWDRLGALEAIYYAGEDPGALRRARRARALVVTARRIDDIRAAGVRADVIVASEADPDEDPWGLPDQLAPGAIVVTQGGEGGVIHERGREARRYAPVPPPGELVCTYGCGDTFAAALTVGLGSGASLDDAVALGARQGALCTTWRGGLGPPP